MHYATHDLRAILSLARMLRRFAEEHSQDNNHLLFLDTAVALEARAHLIADNEGIDELEHNTALHAPVNIMV